MNRINIIRNQLNSENNIHIRNKVDDDDYPVIISAIRSPITKAKKGGLNKTPPEEILSQLLVQIIKKAKINPSEINEIIIGNALNNGCGFISSRAAEIMSNIPKTVPLYTINRLCNSGLQAVINAHNQIKSGQSKIIIAGGVESMSYNNFNEMLSKKLIVEEILNSSKEIKNLLTPMGITNENVCNKFNITREQQDLFAYKSHIKASIAQKKGIFKNEIIPIITREGNVIETDDIIRSNVSIESLSKLRPCFVKNGTTTAGNSSALSDGGALCLLTTKKYAEETNSEILGKIISYSVVGLEPELMGMGPSIAIPSVLKLAGMEIKDIDLFEINEAFAGQALYCINKLKIPENKVNIHGGAIALGHPLGCTGARMIVTLLNELKMYNKKRGIVSMCIGTGMGAACIIER